MEESQEAKKTLKNQYTNQSRQAKKKILQDQIKAASNRKGVWALVNQVKNPIPPLIKPDGSKTTTDLHVCEVFLASEHDKA